MHRHHDFASLEGRGHRGHFGRRGRRYGHFAAGFLGGPGMRVAKMLASGDLQLIILALLSEKPRHGYEIIKQVEEHSSGAYTPSPGMVYPALTYLEEMGYGAVARYERQRQVVDAPQPCSKGEMREERRPLRDREHAAHIAVRPQYTFSAGEYEHIDRGIGPRAAQGADDRRREQNVADAPRHHHQYAARRPHAY